MKKRFYEQPLQHNEGEESKYYRYLPTSEYFIMLRRFCFLAFYLTFFVFSIHGSERAPNLGLFEAIRLFEAENYKEAAQLFKRFAGHSPAAELYCQDLIRKKHLEPYELMEPIPDHPEAKKAQRWFEVSNDLNRLKRANQKQLNIFRERALKDHNGPLFYAIATLYEDGTENIAKDKEKAVLLFRLAFRWGDPRALIRLNRLLDAEEKKAGIPDSAVSFSTLSAPLSLIESAGLFEDDVCFRISIALKDKDPGLSDHFLYKAAQFGHTNAQFLIAQSKCPSEKETLYWAIQASHANHLEALGLVGHFFEKGKGAKTNYSKAFFYLQRAAQHPNATDLDYSNFAVMHQDGKGTAVNYEKATEWYGKALEKNPTDLETVYHYGKSLFLAGKHEEGIGYLERAKALNEEALLNYAVYSHQLSQFKKTPVSSEIIEIFKEFARKGLREGIVSLASLVHSQETDVNIPALIAQLKGITASKHKSETLIALYGLYDKIHDREKVAALLKEILDINPAKNDVRARYAQALVSLKKYQEALVQYQRLEKNGEISAHNGIGLCYTRLSLEEKDSAKSQTLAGKAFEHYMEQLKPAYKSSPDAPAAAFNIYGLLLQERLGKKANKAEIFHYLRLAAESGDEEALNDMGSAYLYGEYGLTESAEEAERYYRLAIKNGCSLAKMNLLSLRIFKGEASSNLDEILQLYLEMQRESPSLAKGYLDFFSKQMKEIKEEKEDLPMDASSPPAEEEEASLPRDESPPPVEEEEADLPSDPSRPFAKVREEKDVSVPQKERQQKEEERVKRKLDRLCSDLNGLQSKKVVKFRKVQTIMKKYIEAFGGYLASGKGSGRRIKLGDEYSGFHQPHGPGSGSDFRGGALTDMTALMGQASFAAAAR